ncbi:3-hydroxyacyl-CoA dehydrogenase [Microvirga sp. SRT01]|uniref:3-hydroxyacyl-CoA dehydrogenase n=1 Tax=Sphingomonas longa TaxID=2778730 RepID=A0ABS2DA61_9SPHN|nr:MULTISPECIES: 3-hydroxyacyl-CoA dehydrogenase [Alphaproteobacteria]MBM6577815.1 3-hydroxyacyl-CoA dehydrogenase [Sphingomonas sp. BT552]MBR7710857.1 3-hydroxyacyl-CoA dehydrogenase [Microvirga sp. SRT01]
MTNTTNTVLVIGAGIMGTGIAHGFAVAGANVLLNDASPEATAKAAAAIGTILDGAVAIGKLSAEDAAAARARITVEPDLAAAASCSGLVVETASERLDVKIAIFDTVSVNAPAGAVLTSNTSALSITELAATTPDPTRFAGMHFFNPVHKMKLVEIVRGLQTSPETVALLTDWATRMGKQSIAIAEAPGFTTSRMSAMLGNEAMYMLQEGVGTAEDIDTALRMGLGHPMGPLELGDMTGWDTRLSVLKYLHSTLGEKFRPCPLIEKMVKSGRYGRKVGHGVYKYDAGQKVAGSGLSAR